MDVFVADNYAYVPADNFGFSTISVEDPVYPDVDIEGESAYLTGNQGGLWIVSVSDPTNPVRKRAFRITRYGFSRISGMTCTRKMTILR